MFSQTSDYKNKILEELREVLRSSIEEEKEKFIQMCIRTGTIDYNEQKISKY